MIQTVLFFTLGFLCAGFIALMVAPAIWRRAVVLTRRRIEASVPLTLNEIQADKDRMRAEFAMSTRRLEMSVKEFRDKAASQIVEINRNREELRKAVEERDRHNRSIAELEARASDLRTELRQAEEKLQQTGTRLAATERQLEERARELEKLSDMYEEASLTSSTRQIELVKRESEFERVASDLKLLRNQGKEGDRRIREVTDEMKRVQQSLKDEKKRATELERRLERTTTALAERDGQIEQRDAQLSSMRSELAELRKAATQNAGDAATDTNRIALEAENAELKGQLATLVSGATGGDVEKAVGRLEEDRTRLEKRLTTLTRENKKLRDELKQVKTSQSEEWTEERRGNALLREQINDIAAEIVHLTALLDGPGSKVHELLAAQPQVQADGLPVQPNPAIVSLADRVRALQKAAATAPAGA